MCKILRLIASLFTLFLFHQALWGQCPATDDYSGSGLQTYTVPTDAAEVTLTLTGADGGDTNDATGGSGATITASFPVCPECTVKPGSTINLYLGGAGESTTTFGGAGGGGASIAIVDGVAYPLIIAGGGAGASNTDGGGGESSIYAALQDEQGGTANLAGGGGSGAGSTALDDTEDTAGNGSPTSSTNSGGAAHAVIMTNPGGTGGTVNDFGFVSQNGIGGNGGLGGGGAGGDGYNYNDNILTNNDAYGGGGGGGGYNGGNAGGGQFGGTGGTSYLYPGNIAVIDETDGASGGGAESDGTALICYVSNASKATCDPAQEQLINPGYSEFGNVDQGGLDKYIDNDDICFEGWERTGDFTNYGGEGQGAVCTEAILSGASGSLSQTVANICQSQKVELCFKFRGTWQVGYGTDISVSLGGQEYWTFSGTDLTNNTFSWGADADNVVVTADLNGNVKSPDDPSDYLVTGQEYEVCITDNNYNGSFPAEIQISGTQTTTTTDYNDIVVEDFTLAYSEIGAPVFQDTTNFAEKPASCEGTFDLTTMTPETVPTGLVLTWKDASGTEVADPTAVGSGTYSLCYSREANNPECTSSCLDETCTQVEVSCSVLPVQLLSFEAEKDGRDAVISWSTASEVNNDYFEVQRSLNGKSFETIGKIKGKGNTSTKQSYSYIDKNIGDKSNIAYYRLNQVDFDNKSSNTDIVLVSFDSKIKAFIYPNPTQSNFSVRMDRYQGIINIRLSDMHGRVVYSQSTLARSIDIMNIKSGVYQVSIFSDSGSILVQESIIVTK